MGSYKAEYAGPVGLRKDLNFFLSEVGATEVLSRGEMSLSSVYRFLTARGDQTVFAGVVAESGECSPPPPSSIVPVYPLSKPETGSFSQPPFPRPSSQSST